MFPGSVGFDETFDDGVRKPFPCQRYEKTMFWDLSYFCLRRSMMMLETFPVCSQLPGI